MKQDNIVRKGIVRLGRGYPVNKPEQKYLVPRNRLTEFLNVNTLDKKAVQDYCSQYKFIPNDLENGLVAGFESFQNQIKEIVDRATDKTLTQEDLDYINKQVDGIHPKIVFFNEVEMKDFNINVNGVDFEFYDIKRQNKEKNTTEIRAFPSIQSTICWDVMNYVIDNRQYRTCPFCSAYFLVTRNDKVYCSKAHKDLAMEKRRKRKK